MKYLNNYLDFILEAVAKNESRLYYSEKLRNLLKKIESSSEIAKMLLLAENSNQAMDTQTLIDVTDKNDTISFVQVNRILRKYPDINMDGNELHNIDDNPFMFNSSSTKPGGEFWREMRTEMNVGRWSRRIFTDVINKTITDSDIEKFVNLYKAAFDSKEIDSKFELVKGEDIRKWYLETNYASRLGQLGASCMRYKRCQPYLDIYVLNPDVCQLLILKNEEGDKIVGRALVWKLREEDNKYFMDRIYTSKDSDKILFKEWADKKVMDVHGYRSGDDITVQLGNHSYEYYPYMDTFVCYNYSTHILSSDEDKWPGNEYWMQLQSTEGDGRDGNVVWSEYSGEYIQSDDAVWCENVRDWLLRGDAKYLKYKDEWVSTSGDSVVYSNYLDEYYYKDDAVYSEVLDDWLYEEHMDVIKIKISSDDIDYTIKNKPYTYIEIDGVYYSKANYIKDPFTDEYHFKSEKISEADNKTYDDYLIDKIGEEILGKDYRIGLPDEVINNRVRGQLMKLFSEGEYPKDDIVNYIKNDEIFKNDIKNIYWGLKDSDIPIAEDMIPAIFAWIINDMQYNPYDSRLHARQKSHLISIINKIDNDGELSKKYTTWYNNDGRMIGNIAKFCKNFDYSILGKEVYMRYLFLNS